MSLRRRNKENKETPPGSRHNSLGSRSSSGESKFFCNVNDKMAKKAKNGLDYHLVNGLKHAFNIIDVRKQGKLAKSQVQVLCSSICHALSLKYSQDDLRKFKMDQECLSADDVVEYVNSELIKQVNGKSISEPFDKVLYPIVEKERPVSNNVLSSEDVFKLWQVFKKVDVDGLTNIDKEEAAIILQDFMEAIGTPWSQGPLDDFCADCLVMNFWQFVECFETKYIKSMPKSIYQEGLDAISSKYLKEILKTGELEKKGHKVKNIKERWFILVPCNLSYYENKNNLDKKKGEIILNPLSRVESIDDSKNGKCRFSVFCGNKGVLYELGAANQRTKNEWMVALQACIDHSEGPSQLEVRLRERAERRKERRNKEAEEERFKIEQEDIIKKQLLDLENLRIAREEAEAKIEIEAAQLEEEKRRREELEAIKTEYENLLEEEKRARQFEEQLRVSQQELLEEEMSKREELERIKREQELLLDEEKRHRQGLEESSKEQSKILAEERERIQSLEEARIKAEAEMSSAHEKLKSLEEERRLAEEKVRSVRSRVCSVRVPFEKLDSVLNRGIVTHRGIGAFTESQFTKSASQTKSGPVPEPVNKTLLEPGERTEICETNLVKPSEGKEKFEGN